jgi:hypothetical protein
VSLQFERNEIMSEHRVVLLHSSIEESLEQGGTPLEDLLEDLPLSAEKKEELLVTASELRPAATGQNEPGHWVCYTVGQDTTMCYWVPRRISI